MRTKAELIHIRKLIKAKRYNEARYKLIGIDHPTAHRWLHKLNQVDTDYTATTRLPIKFVILSMVLVVASMFVLVVAGGADKNTAISIGVFLVVILLLFMSVWSRNQ